MRYSARSCLLIVCCLLSFASAQNRGGTATVLMPEDLATLNPYVSTAFITLQISPAILEPLVAVDPAGQYYPLLAAEIPTEANGGISKDGLLITWRLREGVVWSDGTPLTADDVVFTYEAASSSGTGSVRAGAYGKVASVTAVDDLTVEVRYNEFETSYLEQFQWGILPRHAAGEVANMANWTFNRNPVGTGPFILSDWRAGDRMTLARNPLYREEGKPYLDNVVYMVVPSEETRAAMMVRGDAEVMVWPGSTQRDVFEAAPNVELELQPSIWNLRMFLNLGERNNPTDGQAPHPILGDVRVRQALAYGIDYDLLIDDLAEGRVVRSTSPFAIGWYACEVEPYAYNPERAAALLEEAGWVMGTGGVRVARGAPHAADGTRLSLDMFGYTDYRLLEQTQLVIGDLWRDLGVELNIRNLEQTVLFGGWADRAARKTGDYDILIYDTGAGINPQLHVFDLLHSSRIPRVENDGAGGNYSRWADAEVDALLETAGVSPSLDARRDAYCAIAERMNDDLPHIYLFQFADGHAFSSRLQGFSVSTWGELSWNVADWWLE